SSYGRPGQRKPDLTAPGGSEVTHRLLVAADTNAADPDTDGGPGLFADQFPNDYTFAGEGSSFSAAQVAGAALLVAQAMGDWSYTEAQALRVKMLLLMTASETAAAAEAPPDPTLDRGGKDRVEGFGRLNVDAAVEAVSQALALGTPVTAALGPGVL